MQTRKKTFLPALTLLLLAPFLGEVLSGSSPPAEFLSPPVFLILVGLYGCGALLVREVARAWGRGWIAILLLGMAYGIYEEGLLVRSFFDPAWMDLGILGSYGRWLGMNWIWSIALTWFHALVSISIPILLVELLFPQHSRQRWLGRGGTRVCCVIFFGMLLLSPTFSNHFPMVGIVACVVCILLLAWLAHNWDPLEKKAGAVNAAKPLRVGMGTLLLTLGLIVGMYALPALGIPALFTFLFLPCLPVIGFWSARRLGCQQWQAVHQWAAAAGALLPWLLLAFSAEANNAARPDDTSGMSLVAGLTILLLLGLRLRIHKRNGDQPALH